MTYQIRFYHLCNTFSLSLMLFINIGCSSISEKQVVLLDPDQVHTMQFRVNNISTDFKKTLPKEKISSRVSANLSESGYSLAMQDNSTYGHDLRGKIGFVKHRSTPAGFSFKAGNSDPRALDFQKADVVP